MKYASELPTYTIQDIADEAFAPLFRAKVRQATRVARRAVTIWDGEEVVQAFTDADDVIAVWRASRNSG
jgi:hypothetical protein